MNRYLQEAQDFFQRFFSLGASLNEIFDGGPQIGLPRLSEVVSVLFDDVVPNGADHLEEDASHEDLVAEVDIELTGGLDSLAAVKYGVLRVFFFEIGDDLERI